MYNELIKSLRVCASSGLLDSCLECPRFENGCDTLREDAADAIEKLSAINDQKMIGEWFGEADGYSDGELVYDTWSCGCCGKYFPEWDEKPDWNYCPNCGADMRDER